MAAMLVVRNNVQKWYAVNPYSLISVGGEAYIRLKGWNELLLDTVKWELLQRTEPLIV
jgi:hypothetical protein